MTFHGLPWPSMASHGLPRPSFTYSALSSTASHGLLSPPPLPPRSSRCVNFMLSMPLLILIAAVCPSGAMSTTYALVTSVQVRPISSEPPRPSALFHDIFSSPTLSSSPTIFSSPTLSSSPTIFSSTTFSLPRASTSFHELPRASTSSSNEPFPPSPLPSARSHLVSTSPAPSPRPSPPPLTCA